MTWPPISMAPGARDFRLCCSPTKRRWRPIWPSPPDRRARPDGVRSLAVEGDHIGFAALALGARLGGTTINRALRLRLVGSGLRVLGTVFKRDLGGWSPLCCRTAGTTDGEECDRQDSEG